METNYFIEVVDLDLPTPYAKEDILIQVFLDKSVDKCYRLAESSKTIEREVQIEPERLKLCRFVL